VLSLAVADRIGLSGGNGSGRSTLRKAPVGLIEPSRDERPQRLGSAIACRPEAPKLDSDFDALEGCSAGTAGPLSKIFPLRLRI
jgi:ATPase subunit of ABC transporter with duplicated ATPase domains